MTKKYRLIQNLPFQKADETEWELCRDAYGSWKVKSGDFFFTWEAYWHEPLTSGFFEEIKPERWRAEEQTKYYVFTVTGRIDYFNETNTIFDTAANEFGNYFKTREDAQLALDKFIKPAFDAAHEELQY